MSALAIAVALAVAAIAFAARLPFARRRAPRLPPAGGALDESVQVLVPMRDEAENAESVLRAALAQTVPVRIRALDDGSTDGTAEIVARLAADDPRVELLRVPAPPPGLSGKVQALAFGARGVAAEWILALDADARPAPDAVARALAAASERGLDAVSLAASQEVGSVGEALITPTVFALLDALLGDWRTVADGRGDPVANGQFFLVRRSALESIGGYGSIASEPLDDVALARRLHAGGHGVGFWRAGRTLTVRMYCGGAATWRGWRRNLALILGDRAALVATAALVPLVPALAAALFLVLGELAAALVAWLGGVTTSVLARAGTGSSPLWGLLYPLDALALAANLVAAAGDRARGMVASWRGRNLEL